jgi:Zn-dependent M28 family amino/carboxypeptidase
VIAPPRTRRSRHRGVAAFAAAALAAPLLLGAASPASARPVPGRQGAHLARKLVQRAGAEGAMRHLRVLQAIARLNDGTRAAGTEGHRLSALYAGTLLKAAGYRVTYQDFDFTYVDTLAEKLTVLSPDRHEVPVKLMTYTTSTPEGGIEAALAQVPPDEDTGCTAADFAGGGYRGRIALIRRGGCTFAVKQANAADAGAVGAVVANNVDGELSGTLGDPDAGRIPTGGVSKADGEALAAALAQGEVRLHLEIREYQEQRSTPNVIAETPGGDPHDVVMLGAHLDSVPAGPGINDDGSGSAALLETALQLARTDRHGRHPNKVRFALWSAEELGLLGSDHYVAQLSPQQRDDIALYLNFDMIASPNYGLFVYDGDDSDGVGSGPGPQGSAQLEQHLVSFLASRGFATRGTDFDGRSDYGPFIEAGIPSGGTFTGAEGIKTKEEAKLWGGRAGVAYDPCYHQACDDLDNLDMTAYEANIDAIADAVGHYAWDTGGLDTPAPHVATAEGQAVQHSDTTGTLRSGPHAARAES